MTTKGYWQRFKKLPKAQKLQRVWSAFNSARTALDHARAAAADDGMFPMRETALAVAQANLRRATQRYEKTRAEWEAAGCPDRRGKLRARPASPGSPSSEEPTP